MRRGKIVVGLTVALVGAVMALTACQSSDNNEMPTLGKVVATPQAHKDMCKRQPESALCKR